MVLGLNLRNTSFNSSSHHPTKYLQYLQLTVSILTATVACGSSMPFQHYCIYSTLSGSVVAFININVRYLYASICLKKSLVQYSYTTVSSIFWHCFDWLGTYKGSHKYFTDWQCNFILCISQKIGSHNFEQWTLGKSSGPNQNCDL